MKLINLEQGTADWHKFRLNHIGASDMAPLLGISPYKTRNELWLEKVEVSNSQVENANMRYGKDTEEYVRNILKRELGCYLVPHVCKHQTINWMSASVDGIDLHKRICVEIKSANAVDHELAKRELVPPKYYPQLQQIIETCELDTILYCSFHKDELIYFPVIRDELFIKKIIIAGNEFWDQVLYLRRPEINDEHKEFTKEPYIEREDEHWNNLSLLWKNLQIQKKEILAHEELLRSNLISLSGEQNTEGNGVRISKRIRKGSIIYQDIEILKDIDLEIYRKPSIEYWVIESD